MTAHPKPRHKKRRFKHTSKEVFKAVEERSEKMCERCGRPAEQMSHWPPIGMGGTSVPRTEEDVEYLCHRCHFEGRHGEKQAKE